MSLLETSELQRMLFKPSIIVWREGQLVQKKLSILFLGKKRQVHVFYLLSTSLYVAKVLLETDSFIHNRILTHFSLQQILIHLSSIIKSKLNIFSSSSHSKFHVAR